MKALLFFYRYISFQKGIQFITYTVFVQVEQQIDKISWRVTYFQVDPVFHSSPGRKRKYLQVFKAQIVY